MSKSGIKKFIFQDAQVFVRIKMTAKKLVIKKDGDQYFVEFVTKGENSKITNIPVQFMSTLGDLVDKNLANTSYKWGKLIEKKCQTNSFVFFYFLVPEKNDFAVKMGPITKANLDSDIEIDWPNAQWGTTDS